MRLIRRFPKNSPNSSAMTVCVITPMAKNIVVTPNTIRKELKTRPAWLKRRISL